MKAADSRRRDLAFIHSAKKALALDEDTYRTMLFTLTRKRSAGELDDAERARVKDHLRARGFERAGPARSTDPAPRPREAPPPRSPASAQTGGPEGRGPRAAIEKTRGAKPSVSAERQGLVDKLEALLADAARPWNYARAMALRMFGLQLEWCTGDQLRRLVAALEYDKRRRAAREEKR